MVLSTQFIQRSTVSVAGISLMILGLFSSAAVAQDEIDLTTNDAPPADTVGEAVDLSEFDLQHPGLILTSSEPIKAVPEPSGLLGLALVGGFCLRQRVTRQKCAS